MMASLGLRDSCRSVGPAPGQARIGQADRGPAARGGMGREYQVRGGPGPSLKLTRGDDSLPVCTSSSSSRTVAALTPARPSCMTRIVTIQSRRGRQSALDRTVTGPGAGPRPSGCGMLQTGKSESVQWPGAGPRNLKLTPSQRPSHGLVEP